MRQDAFSKPASPYWHLLWEMTRGEIRMRDQGALLGFLWTLLHPALMFAVLYGLFSKWFGRLVDQYMVRLLVGIVLWNCFQKSTSYALGSFRRSRGTILNYRFPREIVVFAAVGAVLWSSLMEMFVMMVAVVLLGQPPRLAWLFLPLLLILEFVLATGISLFLAVWSAEYQDLERIWDVLTSALFYLTPIFYPLTILSPNKRALLNLNPLARIIEAFRGCVISGHVPRPEIVLALFATGTLLFAAGLALVRRRELEIADYLLV